MISIRRYTLLAPRRPRHPGQLISTRPAGTVLAHVVGGRAERFVLTNAVLYDGIFAAEPLDRYL
ncbi:hypothetical protein [Streptomyces sp. H39-C1]|uniref:hypothetical protein n=1 Tax=Streptomyces sp. H39-C1 TaxID=3004355 RepID=UPI0022AEC78B|nr:hypothetical protein [Streptomyces sp. H39-C1]MCZ4101105.1 hypothetical protein [Streptomyces sp. H39-C1]